MTTVRNNFGERSANDRVPLRKVATGGRWCWWLQVKLTRCQIHPLEKMCKDHKSLGFQLLSCLLPQKEWQGQNGHRDQVTIFLLSKQFLEGKDWRHAVGRAERQGQFALLLFWLDLLGTGEKPSAGQQSPAHPFSPLSKTMIQLLERKHSVIWLVQLAYHSGKEITT